MSKSATTASTHFRFNALAACLATALATTASLASGGAAEWPGREAMPVFPSVAPATPVPSPRAGMARRPGAHAVASTPPGPASAPQPASTKPVISCLDDGSTGTLRDLMTHAVSGDVIDLSGLACSTITLRTGNGVIVTQSAVSSLTVNGPADGHLTIDGGNSDDGIFEAYGAGTLTLQNLTLANSHYTGEYPYGGAVFSSGSLVLSNSTVTNNSTTGNSARAGAIFARLGATIANSTLSGNTVHSTGGTHLARGGAMYTAGGATISNSSFFGNSVTADAGAAGYGGAIAVAGTVTIASSTFNGNSASSGSAVSIFKPSSNAVLSNVTVSGNTASTLGAAIGSEGTLRLSNSTVAFNQSTVGPGGLGLGAGTELESSIVSNNTTAASGVDGNIGGTSGATLSGANNVIPTSGITPPAGTISIDPLLQPLADNGGAVDSQPHPKTHALLSGSSAVNAGNNVAGLPLDERGHARVSGAVADVGAFELDDTIFRDGF